MIKLYSKSDCFSLSNRTCRLLDVSVGDGLMFSFNYKEEKVSVFKDNEEDCFRLNQIEYNDCVRKILRFKSVDLCRHFLDCFGLDNHGVHSFIIVKKVINGKRNFVLEYVA